jgi:uncharacterized protein (DUF58 family)
MTQIPPIVVVRRHRAITVTFVLLSAAVLALATFGALALSHLVAKPFDPLYFPGQHVATATVKVGGTVTVTTTRCNRSKKPVTYRAVKTWKDVDDPGTEYLVGITEATQPPGCTHYTFTNPMPASVISRTTGLLSTGRKHVTWVIAAVDTPEGHARPVTVSWTTTNIVVTK